MRQGAPSEEGLQCASRPRINVNIRQHGNFIRWWCKTIRHMASAVLKHPRQHPTGDATIDRLSKVQPSANDKRGKGHLPEMAPDHTPYGFSRPEAPPQHPTGDATIDRLSKVQPSAMISGKGTSLARPQTIRHMASAVPKHPVSTPPEMPA